MSGVQTLIQAGLDDLSLTGRVPPQAAAQLARYGQLLLEKNQVMNLTAIREEDQVARLHMLDCATLVGLQALADKRLIDVGTGAGFPGLALKILVPSLQVTLLDSLNKRLDWLQEVAQDLSLDGVTTVHARAEEQAMLRGQRDSYDLATARAVAQLRLLTELCLPFVAPGGLFLAMKSVDSDGEIQEAERCIKMLGGRLESVQDYTIPGTDVRHRLVAIRKVAPTLKGYPRRWAKIQKDPL